MRGKKTLSILQMLDVSQRQTAFGHYIKRLYNAFPLRFVGRHQKDDSEKDKEKAGYYSMVIIYMMATAIGSMDTNLMSPNLTQIGNDFKFTPGM